MHKLGLQIPIMSNDTLEIYCSRRHRGFHEELSWAFLLRKRNTKDDFNKPHKNISLHSFICFSFKVDHALKRSIKSHDITPVLHNYRFIGTLVFLTKTFNLIIDTIVFQFFQTFDPQA